MRALVSVHNKTGLAEFAHSLNSLGFEIVSTGGTLAFLKENGIPAISVSEITGFPEILDGRVKTLHPAVHGGLLGLRGSDSHTAEMSAHGIVSIDIVVSNLYPFREVTARDGASLEDALENIDIGGPAMIRAGAKNFPNVLTVINPDDYPSVQKELEDNRGNVSDKTRRRLAAKAFREVSQYDDAVSNYVAEIESNGSYNSWPGQRSWRKVTDLRYGENPHQTAATYSPTDETGGIANAQLLSGIPMSYLNYLDADAAWQAVHAFDEHACAIVKHANPCGLAVRSSQADSFRCALDGDRVSAFGGIVGFNTAVTRETAEEMAGTLFDVIAAPDYQPEALDVLRTRRRRTRILKVKPISEHFNEEFRSISGGLLLQSPDFEESNAADWRVVTERAPSTEELTDLEFAWRVCRFVRSNAIVFAKDRAITGIGAGQPNRVASVDLAASVAGVKAKGSVAASDAFFPFPDGVIRAVTAGVTCLVQPGGSVRDSEVIEAANDAGLAMLFTGIRHFSH